VPQGRSSGNGRRTDEVSWQRGLTGGRARPWATRRHARRRRGLGIALAGQAGATVDEDFPELAALAGPDGEVTARLPDWRPGVLLADIPCVGSMA
jgi:predicted amidohydrolase